jgi:hypothetical protein
VEDAENKRGHEWAVHGLEARQGEAAPARLLAEGRQDQADQDERQELGEQQGRVVGEGGQRIAGQRRAVGGEPDEQRKEHRHGVPTGSDAPLDDATAQLARTLTAVDRARDKKRRKERPGIGRELDEQEIDAFRDGEREHAEAILAAGKGDRPDDEPGPEQGEQEVGDERLAGHPCGEARGREG